MHDVRRILPPGLAQPARGRQAELQLGIAWNGNAAHEDFLIADGDMRFVVRAMARTYDLNMMAVLTQALDEATERHRHAVDFRRIGFGHDGDPQGFCGLSRRYRWVPCITFLHETARGNFVVWC